MARPAAGHAYQEDDESAANDAALHFTHRVLQKQHHTCGKFTSAA
jgi:hypothetical protein